MGVGAAGICACVAQWEFLNFPYPFTCSCGNNAEWDRTALVGPTKSHHRFPPGDGVFLPIPGNAPKHSIPPRTEGPGFSELP